MAHELSCRVAGCGMAWLKAWQTQPKLDFHFTDRAHPNANGYYLNACVLYAALTDTTPVGLDAVGVSKEDAGFLQKIASDQYQEDREKEKK